MKMAAIVDAASAAFYDCTDARRQVEIVSREKWQIKKINKDFKRAIDSWAEGRPGAKRCAINQRESLEVLLQKYHYETLCKLDGLLQSLDHGDS